MVIRLIQDLVGSADIRLIQALVATLEYPAGVDLADIQEPAELAVGQVLAAGRGYRVIVDIQEKVVGPGYPAGVGILAGAVCRDIVAGAEYLAIADIAVGPGCRDFQATADTQVGVEYQAGQDILGLAAGQVIAEYPDGQEKVAIADIPLTLGIAELAGIPAGREFQAGVAIAEYRVIVGTPA